MNAVLGAPTDNHVIYDHLDVMVHPLGIHLNEHFANAFWVRPAEMEMEALFQISWFQYSCSRSVTYKRQVRSV